VDITQELQRLSRFVTTDAPVISVYLDTQWRDLHQHERTITFLKRHIGQAAEVTLQSASAMQSLQDDLARLTDWSTKLRSSARDPLTPGLALFACSEGDLWVEFPAPVAFDNEFTVADRPALRQLARLNAEYTTTLVALVDTRAARICEIVFGGLLTETDIVNEVPGRHQQGGWAQMRYQRHVKDHMDRHHKEVADYLNAYVVEHPQTFVILSGQEGIVANLRPSLSAAVQERLLDTVQLDIRQSQADIVRVARELIQEHEREEEQEFVQRLLNRAGHGGLAVVGLQETLAAANTGRMHMLIMHRDLTEHGSRCTNCDTLSEETLATCSVCGGTLTAVDLGEALVNRALQTDAFVELIEPDARLTTYEGVGALLRYK
jgi:peptide chain release factor subunit 1